jgi:hypothetical protein
MRVAHVKRRERESQPSRSKSERKGRTFHMKERERERGWLHAENPDGLFQIEALLTSDQFKVSASLPR